MEMNLHLRRPVVYNPQCIGPLVSAGVRETEAICSHLDLLGQVFAEACVGLFSRGQMAQRDRGESDKIGSRGFWFGRVMCRGIPHIHPRYQVQTSDSLLAS